MLEFSWDERKNRSNQKKHGVWFEEAKSVFDDHLARLFLEGSGLGEERFTLIGHSTDRRLLVVVHCYRESDTVVRIISARQASKKERIFYEEGI
ncbi:MAG: BrnT family toxin [Proteobacteria bacterium]|nr:MAG: BrnT family toxin [Pseudomonadota bacterium]